MAASRVASLHLFFPLKAMKKIVFLTLVMLTAAGSLMAQHIEYKWRGFYSVADLSFNTNVNRSVDTVNAFSASVIAGFQFRKEICIGLGASYVFDPTGAFSQVPVFMELRTNIMRSRLTPYTAIQVGYSMPVGSSSEPPSIQITQGGFYSNIEFGGRYAIRRNLAVGAHIGYKVLQSNEVTRLDINNVPMLADAVTLHMINAGVSFHF